MRYFLFPILLPTLLMNCADRERNNPLDPKNQETGGKPVGLQVTSQGKKVILIWSSVQIDDLLGTKIFRNSNTNPDFQEIVLVKDKTRFEDTGVEYGVRYDYKIQVVTKTYESPFSEQVSITPGPSAIWVTTGTSGSVLKLSHDASHRIFELINFLFPLGIASVGSNQGVFIADYYLNQVVRVTESGAIINHISGFGSPTAIDYDPIRRRFWVADRDLGSIIISDTLGSNLNKVATFTLPAAISVNKSSGDCWVADSGDDKVAVINGNTLNSRKFPGFSHPSDVDVNPFDGTCWVADSTQIVKLNSNGTHVLEVSGFNYAARISVNERTGDCWVIDWMPGINTSKVIKVSSAGLKILEVSNFYDPQALDVDTFDGSCLVADSRNFRVVKLSSSGEQLGEWQASGRPMTVKVVTQ